MAQDEAKLTSYRGEDGVVKFVRDILRASPTPYQEKILRALVAYRRVAVHGPHGLGKTALAAWFVLWVMTVHTEDVKVVTTASAWRQLTHYLWPEIRKWALNGRWADLDMQMRPGKELFEEKLALPGGRQAFAAASDKAETIEGAHAKTMVYVFDESKAIPIKTWDAAEGAFSTGDCYALAISTPGEQSGRFYDICARKVGFDHWHVIHVTLEEAIQAGRIDRQWANTMRDQWGENSEVYQQRVLGVFVDSDARQLIPLSWVEAANERFRMCEGKGPADAPVFYGVDPAYTGADQTAIATKRGDVIEDVSALSHRDTMETAGRVKHLLDAAPNSRALIDVIGIGAGVYNRLREQQAKATSVDVRKKTNMRDSTGLYKFENLRAYLWWNARERLNPAGENPVALPPHDLLTRDLTTPTYEHHSSGVIKVEKKEDMIARTGRSPDYADAVLLALFADAAPPLHFYDALEW